MINTLTNEGGEIVLSNQDSPKAKIRCFLSKNHGFLQYEPLFMFNFTNTTKMLWLNESQIKELILLLQHNLNLLNKKGDI